MRQIVPTNRQKQIVHSWKLSPLNCSEEHWTRFIIEGLPDLTRPSDRKQPTKDSAFEVAEVRSRRVPGHGASQYGWEFNDNGEGFVYIDGFYFEVPK